MTLAEKLNPNRFTAMSGFMAAVVGYVLGESFTNPQIAEITVSEEEGFAYIRKEGDIGFNDIESLKDLRDNWNNLMNAADLTPDERREAVRLFKERVGILPGTGV
jgi:hypothetical protein